MQTRIAQYHIAEDFITDLAPERLIVGGRRPTGCGVEIIKVMVCRVIYFPP
jgi:hypothetical protein